MAQVAKLQGFDVVLAIRLLKPAGTLAELAAELGVVPSQIHASVKRLEIAGLVRPGTRNANRHALQEFIEHGVRYAFPAQVGRPARGIPTSHSGPLLAEHIDSADAFVLAGGQRAGLSQRIVRRAALRQGSRARGVVARNVQSGVARRCVSSR